MDVTEVPSFASPQSTSLHEGVTTDDAEAPCHRRVIRVAAAMETVATLVGNAAAAAATGTAAATTEARVMAAGMTMRAMVLVTTTVTAEAMVTAMSAMR